MSISRAFLIVVVTVCCVVAAALAHPADEFCGPDSDLDPALCLALQQADSATPAPREQAVETSSALERSVPETLWVYVKIGVAHIIPAGLDHMLFVVALVVTTPRLRSLLWQISAFTLAHTTTLGAAAADVLPRPDPAIIEPLIAASIAFVAIEGLVWRQPPRWRVAIIFMFGLLHGFGFAGAFSELGLPDDQFVAGLLGFNIGVEIGQISVAALAVAAIGAALYYAKPADELVFRWRFVTLPTSLLIGATGLFWAAQRVMG